MEAQQFLAEFGHIANTLEGVARLRELVLLLAVQGRLTKSHQTWTSVTLGELGKWGSGGTPAKTYTDYYGGNIPWLVIGDLSDGLVVSASDSITQKGLENSSAKLIPTGALLIGMYGSIGKLGITTFECATNQAIAHCVVDESKALTQYLFTFIRAMRGHLFSLGKGLAQQNISQTILKSQKIQLPPMEEQSAIVSRVDELMALCDKLEAQQQDRRKLQNALRQSILQVLASAQSPRELQDSWQRLQTNFRHLFSEPGDVRLLRDALFDLALRGILLAKSTLTVSNDSPSRELSPLPSGWEWKTLADLSDYITSGSRGWKAYMTNLGDSFIRSQDIRQDALIFENPAFVTLPEQAEGKRTRVRPGDLLLTITGGNVGRCAVVSELPNCAYVSQHVALIRLQEPSQSEFIHFWMINTFGGRAFLARYIYGDKPGLNLAQVGSVPIPIPPATVLPEILTTLRRHQQLCDSLEKQLDAKCDVGTELCSAAVAALTGTTLEQGEADSVKAPQTELIAPLRLSASPNVKAQAPLATLLARHNGEMSARDLWQRFGGEIDAFYTQLKSEVAHGWITEPEVAKMREKATEAARA